MIEIHETAIVSPLADLEDSRLGTRIVIGEGSRIDSFVKIKPAGGNGDVLIGSYCFVNSGCVLYSGNGIRIGDHVSIAANCTLAATNHAYLDRSRLIQRHGFMPSRGGIVVDDDVWIGANCAILDGSHLAQGCVVAAGSVVRGHLAEYTIYGGNPLRVLGVRT